MLSGTVQVAEPPWRVLAAMRLAQQFAIVLADPPGATYAGGLRILATKDAAEGVRAFVEKRTPNWTGG